VWKEGGTAPEGTDMWAVANGWVSVTPISVNQTDVTPSTVANLKSIFSN
jgi:broad specificity polyphosphatase/5'/3'-nucleotidase SurE